MADSSDLSVDPELKTFTSGFTGASYMNLDTSGQVELLTEIPLGVDQFERIGKKILLDSIEIRGTAINLTAAKLNLIGVALVVDKMPRDTIPAVSEIFAGGTGSSILQLENTDSERRFEVVWRWDAVLIGNDSVATNQTSTTMQHIHDVVDMRGRRTVFKLGPNGAIQDHSYGAVYAVTMGSTPAGTGAAKFTGNFRVSYYDE